MLYNYYPYNNKNTNLKYKQIQKGDYNFSHEAWKSISNLVKMLIKKILVVDVNQRYSYQKIMNHEWIITNCSSKQKTLNSSKSKLIN